jgi:hypothetical protein
MGVIITAAPRGICIGEVMITGTILTDLILARYTTTEVNTMNGTGITTSITGPVIDLSSYRY